jgi:hypothetical protein
VSDFFRGCMTFPAQFEHIKDFVGIGLFWLHYAIVNICWITYASPLSILAVAARSFLLLCYVICMSCVSHAL